MSSSTITSASPVVQRLFASFAVPSVSSTPQLETPKKSNSTTRVKKSRPDKRASPKPCFASGSFSESPSARAIPPPPVTWFIEETSETDQSGSDSDVSSSSSVSRDEMKTPVFGEPGQFRVNPLQLIAAVVSA